MERIDNSDNTMFKIQTKASYWRLLTSDVALPGNNVLLHDKAHVNHAIEERYSRGDSRPRSQEVTR